MRLGKWALSMVLMLALTLLCAGAGAETFTSGDYEYQVLEDGTAEIIGYYGSAKELNVPAELDGIRVTSIGYTAFYECTSLTSVTLPDGVTRIEESAFENCSALTSVTLPDSLTSIGRYAFSQCNLLTGVTLPDSLTGIGDYAFEYCSSLTSIVLPDSVTEIYGNPFAHCKSLSSIQVSPNHPSLEVIDGVLFSKRDKKLLAYPGGLAQSEYTVPQGTQYIGDGAFDGCSSLISITLPDSGDRHWG